MGLPPSLLGLADHAPFNPCRWAWLITHPSIHAASMLQAPKPLPTSMLPCCVARHINAAVACAVRCCAMLSHAEPCRAMLCQAGSY